MNGSVCVLITCYLPKHVVGLHSIEMDQKEAQTEGGATQRSLKRLRGDEAEPSVAGCQEAWAHWTELQDAIAGLASHQRGGAGRRGRVINRRQG